MYDVIIIGAGASGLMAATEAAKRGRRTLIIDHAERAGRKVLVSGGGKCNVTNTHISASGYFGADHSFCKYALKRFTATSLLDRLHKAGIETEERDHGRIFCKKGADELVSFLVCASEHSGVHFSLRTKVSEVSHTTHFTVKCENGIQYESHGLLVATGGLAWPQTGATDSGYRIARQFGHKIMPLKPALTGFILSQDAPLRNLQGISLDIQIRIKEKKIVIEEPLLFTHKGISGPSVLQLSCFWEKGDIVIINFLPAEDAFSQMHEPRNGKLFVKNLFMRFLPERLVKAIIPGPLSERKVAELSKKDRHAIAGHIHSFPVCPASVEGFSKAEVTAGGVCTREINPESMESLLLKGLFFSGEVIDITGRLGGYNIHWAFASGYIAGQHL